MTPIVTLIFDVVLAGLLIATIAYAIMLNRGLTELHQSRGEMEALIRSFSEATARAEAGIKAMKRTASETGEGLQRNSERAQALRDELQFMIEAGDSLAQRLAGTAQAGANRPGAARGSSVSERSANERPVNDRSGNERSGGERSGSERFAGERFAGERTGTGLAPARSAAGPASPRRSAAEAGLASLEAGGEPGGGRSFPVRTDTARRGSGAGSGSGSGSGRETGERFAPSEEPRPARREGGDGLSRAERELLEAMENRR